MKPNNAKGDDHRDFEYLGKVPMFQSRIHIILWLTSLGLVLLLSACGGAEPTPAPSPTAEPTTTPRSAVTVAEQPTELPPTGLPATTAPPTQEPPAPAVAPLAEPTATQPAAEPTLSPLPTPQEMAAYGRTNDGFYVRGRADAPITIIDYSDFL